MRLAHGAVAPVNVGRRKSSQTALMAGERAGKSLMSLSSKVLRGRRGPLLVHRVKMAVVCLHHASSWISGDLHKKKKEPAQRRVRVLADRSAVGRVQQPEVAISVRMTLLACFGDRPSVRPHESKHNPNAPEQNR